MKDILVFISDQHAWLQQSYAGDALVRTPNLDRLAAEGTVMQNNCTSYPLCVPARMSMMSGQLSSRCGVMNNMTALDSNRVTFAHCLNAGGYETVLCGRMHFVGPDQRHGFEKRIAGEQTPIYHNRPNEAFARERGVHNFTPQGSLACLSAIGGGNSPTLEYDRYVTDRAVAYLEESHSKPQFLCVGTYGPHHPFVAPRELYEYYLDKVDVPEESFSYPEHPAIAGSLVRETDPEVVRAVRAAYYGMVEFEDQQIGKVYDAFQTYLKRTGHEGVFVYISDHGEHAGYRGYYGKSTFYEQSVHTPMIFVGAGIAKGRELHGATSLMDLGPTLCEITGTIQPPRADGISLCPQLGGGADNVERMVISELGGSFHCQGPQKGKFYYGQMVKYRSYKLIHFDGYDEDDVLYDLAKDPKESVNVIAEYPELAADMRAYLQVQCAPGEQIISHAQEQQENLQVLVKCNFDDEFERWHAPECARHYPDPMMKSKLV
ncbi:sulfatase-like hydrolase/transferase [Lacrimispora sp.]|uniref:sulfatase-like hydrolase/transferase n=1 Tax=Lacrimispora sp. TaxID=2719234 RepID=UPI00289A7510|nr:sulfatase-like hydrolase/transferase [Lacrimispora sp.]